MSEDYLTCLYDATVAEGSKHPCFFIVFPHDVLAAWTGQTPDACWDAVEAADAQGLIEYGTSLRTGWLTEEGQALLEQSGLNPVALSMPTIRRHGAEFKAAVMDAVAEMTPEAQQRLADELEKDEGSAGASAPRVPGLRH